MSKQDEASLILRLYELRREEVMRKARDWYFREFFPDTIDDFTATIFGEHSGRLRMVVTYWDMAAVLVNNGAISLDLFTQTNGEHLSVFAKIESLLPEIRARYSPVFAAQLEKLIDSTPDGRKQVETLRQRLKGIREQLAQRARTAQQS